MESEGVGGIRTAIVVGLGLMGGSIARDLAARGVRVLGWETRRASLEAARREGIVEVGRYDEPADVVILAGAVLTIPDMLRMVMDTMGPRLDAVRLVTDVGSTKSSILRAAEALGIGERFVGSHPLAGDHRSGWEASRTGMFQDARVFLCRAPSTTDDAMDLAGALWAGVGARPEEIDAGEHDERLAWTSHVPQLLSSILGGTLAGQGIPRAELGPGGRDVTRLAGSQPGLWAHIAFDNQAAILHALDAVDARLHAVRDALATGQFERLSALLEQARHWHERG